MWIPNIWVILCINLIKHKYSFGWPCMLKPKIPNQSIMWDILAIFNYYMDIKCLFCREFKFLQYL